MIAVIFEVTPADDRRSAYLDLAAQLHGRLERIDGFLSIERFESLRTRARSSPCRSGATRRRSRQWRNGSEHRAAQQAGRDGIFADYRLRIASVVRDYGMTERDEAPADSRAFHETRNSNGSGFAARDLQSERDAP